MANDASKREREGEGERFISISGSFRERERERERKSLLLFLPHFVTFYCKKKGFLFHSSITK